MCLSNHLLILGQSVSHCSSDVTDNVSANLWLPHEPELKDVYMSTTLYGLISGVIHDVILLILLKKISSTHGVAALQKTLKMHIIVCQTLWNSETDIKLISCSNELSSLTLPLCLPLSLCFSLSLPSSFIHITLQNFSFIPLQCRLIPPDTPFFSLTFSRTRMAEHCNGTPIILCGFHVTELALQKQKIISLWCRHMRVCLVWR